MIKVSLSYIKKYLAQFVLRFSEENHSGMIFSARSNLTTVKNKFIDEHYNKKMVEDGRDTWMKHGALGYYECRDNDLAPQEMGDEKGRSFTEMAGAGANDTVWFSFIILKPKNIAMKLMQK